jgi:hypothetical protein
MLVIWYKYFTVFFDIFNAVCWVKYYDCHTVENDFGSLYKFDFKYLCYLPCLANSFTIL